MSQNTFSFNLHQITKIEGHAFLNVDVSDNQVNTCQFGIGDYKRFYTKAVEKKPAAAAPQLLSRICGTCSNSHIAASLKAVESALGIEVPDSVKHRRELINTGLYIRDHTLHLIVFVLPDVYNVDSILDFDETDPTQRAMLENLLKLKAAGNNLSNFSGGRSVHAPDLMVGGFAKPLDTSLVPTLIEELKQIRPIAVQLAQLFAQVNFSFIRNSHYLALRGDNHFDYLLGHKLKTHDGREIPDRHYRQHLQHVSIPYSHASGYKFEGQDFLVGSLARVNLNADQLHPNTKQSLSEALGLFPSNNVYHNNLAQAIETVDSIDRALDLLAQIPDHQPNVPPQRTTGDGIGIIEAPRGTLYHSAHVINNIIDRYEVIVPTGQNQINIENDLKKLIEELLPTHDQTSIERECEKLIRAYDPCMSCASHFLKVRWNHTRSAKTNLIKMQTSQA